MVGPQLCFLTELIRKQLQKAMIKEKVGSAMLGRLYHLCIPSSLHQPITKLH